MKNKQSYFLSLVHQYLLQRHFLWVGSSVKIMTEIKNMNEKNMNKHEL